jgi:CBS domain-containing protein
VPTAETLLERKGSHVVTVDKDATVLDAAKTMNDHRIGAVIVVSGEQALGVFTERDILCRVVAARRDAADVKVSEVMTTPMACCTRKTKLAECRAVMTEKKIRHLPVVEEGKLYGMISSGDILANEVATKESTIQYLSDYIYGRT